MFEATVAQLINAGEVAAPNVVREEAPKEIVTMISKRDIIGCYYTKSTR